MPNKPIAIVAILTIYHNLQYHRLIWFHNKKYSRSLPAPTGTSFTGTAGVPPAMSAKREQLLKNQNHPRQKYGAAELISRRLLYYIAFGILFGIIYQGPRQLLGYVNLKNGGLNSEPSFPVQLGISFLWGYAFIHYYLDSKVWRVRRDPSVGKALNMG
jgi:hypothetical protein